MARRPKKFEHVFEFIEAGKRIELAYGDLRDANSLVEIFKRQKFDFVFHLGAQSYPKTSFSNQIETYSSNIIGTENLFLSAIHKYAPDARVHNCSSSEVFGRVPPEKLPIDEECTFHPASPYAISKIGTDMIGRYYGEAYGMKVYTTRMFTHTGPRRGDVFAESTFAKQIALIEAGKIDPVVKVGNIKSKRTWADVRDAVKAYHMLLKSEKVVPGDYFNIGGKTVKTIEEMLQFLISQSSRSNEITVEQDENRLRPIDADLQIPDTKKFEAVTGWYPQYKFEQTMTDLLDYWER